MINISRECSSRRASMQIDVSANIFAFHFWIKITYFHDRNKFWINRYILGLNLDQGKFAITPLERTIYLIIVSDLLEKTLEMEAVNTGSHCTRCFQCWACFVFIVHNSASAWNRTPIISTYLFSKFLETHDIALQINRQRHQCSMRLLFAQAPLEVESSIYRTVRMCQSGFQTESHSKLKRSTDGEEEEEASKWHRNKQQEPIWLLQIVRAPNYLTAQFVRRQFQRNLH